MEAYYCRRILKFIWKWYRLTISKLGKWRLGDYLTSLGSQTSLLCEFQVNESSGLFVCLFCLFFKCRQCLRNDTRSSPLVSTRIQ